MPVAGILVQRGGGVGFLAARPRVVRHVRDIVGLGVVEHQYCASQTEILPRHTALGIRDNHAVVDVHGDLRQGVPRLFRSLSSSSAAHCLRRFAGVNTSICRLRSAHN